MSMKKDSNHPILIKEMLIKIHNRYNFISTRTVTIKRTENLKE